MADRTMTSQAMQKGYPALANILTTLNAAGIEAPGEFTVDFVTDFWRLLWASFNFAAFAGALGVYKESDTTYRVRGGQYVWNNTVKTYSQAAAVDPTDNDTTYVWMNDDNTIGAAVDGTGWPGTDHVKLAEVVVDSDGVITAITDLRGQSFLRRLPEMPTGDVVGTSDTQTLTNKTIDGDTNTIQDLNADVLKVLTASMAVPFVLKATVAAGATVQVYDAAAPFKFEIVAAWSVATSADGGTWKLTDGTNDVTDTVAVTATDKTVNRAGAIDDACRQIAAGGSLSVVGDGANADADVYIQCVRVA